jgi:hypothetical protein
MLQLLRIGRHGALLGVLLALLHCGGSDIVLPSEAGPATITKHDGDQQEGPVGTALAHPVVVRVVDQRGEPVRRQEVAFTPGEDAVGAQLDPQVATTDADGLARTEWVLGTTRGSQSLVATVVNAEDLTVTFEATARSAEPTRLHRPSRSPRGPRD